MRRNILGVFLLLALVTVASSATFAPVFAKDLNLPPGADRVVYYSGGNASINLPTILPLNYPPTATKMTIIAMHSEIPNAGIDSESLVISLYMIRQGAAKYSWQPYAVITTSLAVADFMRVFWRGTFIEWDATLYGLPSALNTDNVIVVDESVLKVERHGNNINVNLNAPQQIKLGGSGIPSSKYFALPAFNMELNSYGGSVHFESTVVMSGWLGACGYTLESEVMGFHANGAFTCTDPAWNLNAVAVTDALITMHGIQTFYPPPPP